MWRNAAPTAPRAGPASPSHPLCPAPGPPPVSPARPHPHPCHTSRVGSPGTLHAARAATPAPRSPASADRGAKGVSGGAAAAVCCGARGRGAARAAGGTKPKGNFALKKPEQPIKRHLPLIPERSVLTKHRENTGAPKGHKPFLLLLFAGPVKVGALAPRAGTPRVPGVLMPRDPSPETRRARHPPRTR